MLRGKYKGESMFSMLLMTDPGGDPQGVSVAGQREHQRHLRAYGQILRHFCGEAVGADVAASGIQQPRFGIADLQYKMEVGRKARHAITEFLNSRLFLARHFNSIRIVSNSAMHATCQLMNVLHSVFHQGKCAILSPRSNVSESRQHLQRPSFLSHSIDR